MKDLINLTDLARADAEEIFKLADRINRFHGSLHGKTFVLFFPPSSIRTRVTFEKALCQLGAQSILFPSDTLDKPEAIEDVMSYLDNWADGVIVRHKNLELVERMAEASHHPVINAMTDLNHPCEVLSDLYALSKIRKNFKVLNYLFIGASGNIGLAWREAAELFQINYSQCCPPGFEMAGISVNHDLEQALSGKDILITDSFPTGAEALFTPYQLTSERISLANQGALFNPCPPFYRGQEVSADALDDPAFVGYAFKKSLLSVQQAIILFCLKGSAH